jgi:hypothetical protein
MTSTSTSLIPQHLHGWPMWKQIVLTEEGENLLALCLAELDLAHKREATFPLKISLCYDIYGTSKRYEQTQINYVQNELEDAGYTVHTDYGTMTINFNIADYTSANARHRSHHKN